jgi:iron(II)-dependent oxidoreductase
MTSTATPGTVAAIAIRLAEARQRTWRLVRPVSDEDLVRQHDPLMGPLQWDLGHIAHFEDLWLTRNLDGGIRFSEMPGMYNPFEHPRRVRGELRYPIRDECFAMMAGIRERVLERLSELDPESTNPLLANGYVYEMVLQHEYQHNETMLQTLQLKQGAPYTPNDPLPIPDGPVAVAPREMRIIPAGVYPVGTGDRTIAYDNERPRHLVSLPEYALDAAPVSNGEFVDFLADDGYARRDLWTAEGWMWRQEEGAIAPRYWERRGDAWWTRTMNRTAPVDPRHPVCHVSYHEADAFARWAGKRLPTEVEWEVAASWDPAAGRQRRFPWGDQPATPERANVDQLRFGTAPIGAFPDNISPSGCIGMIGDVWEWTSSDFTGFPGFSPFPYPEYSEIFFGSEYKVLRGGSWATRSGAVRNTFRNWDYPIRRQIFSGFRCAR